MYNGRRLPKKSRWNKSMQRSTFNCNVPLTGYSRTYRYAFIYVYIYIYISTLAEKSLEIYISSSERLKEGLRAWPEHAHTHSHIKHTRAPGFVGVGHITSLRRAFEVGGVLQESLWSSKLGGSWQSVMETEEGRLMTHESAFTHELGFFWCVWVRLFCCFFFEPHWLTQHVGSH